MAKVLKAIRGMRDILPDKTPTWQYVESTVKDLLSSYAYKEIRMPILERTELFKRSIGEVTDIVEKEMYTFVDRNGDSISLRPESTAGCVRAGVEHGLLYNQTQRIWYGGPMFRHERPQKGRYRQFHQIGVESFGFPGADIEAELIFMCARLWQRLGLDNVVLHVNTLGTSIERANYRTELVSYLHDHFDELDEDSQRRTESNPMRVLDSKNPELQRLIDAAPKLMDFLNDESKQHFRCLLSLLEANSIDYVVNPRLVRGLDYYSHTVFEWITDQLGAQGTVCAGGRYDGLVEQLGGKATPAVGFAMGVERLVELLESTQQIPISDDPHVYIIAVGPDAQVQALLLAEQLRDASTSLRVQVNCGGGGVKTQMKRADRSGAGLALLLGDTEIEANAITVKPLRSDEVQFSIPQNELLPYLLQAFSIVV